MIGGIPDVCQRGEETRETPGQKSEKARTLVPNPVFVVSLGARVSTGPDSRRRSRSAITCRRAIHEDALDGKFLGVNARVMLTQANVGGFEIGSYAGALFGELPPRSLWRIEELIHHASALGWDLVTDRRSGLLRSLHFQRAG